MDVLQKIDKGRRKLLIELMDDDVRHDIEVIASFDEDEIGSRMTNQLYHHPGKSHRQAGYEQPHRTGGQE